MIPAAYALYRRSTTQQDLSIEEQRAAVRPSSSWNVRGSAPAVSPYIFGFTLESFIWRVTVTASSKYDAAASTSGLAARTLARSAEKSVIPWG